MNPMILAAAVLAGGLPPPEERPVYDFRNFATGYGGFAPQWLDSVRHGGSENYVNTRSQKRKRRDMRRRYPHGW
jgi:hypothetical protein